MTTSRKIPATLGFCALMAPVAALAQQTLPTIEVGAAPLRSQPRLAPAHIAAPAGPVRAAPAPLRAAAPRPSARAASRTAPVRVAAPLPAPPPTFSPPPPPFSPPPLSPIIRYPIPAAAHTISGKELHLSRQFDLSASLQRVVPGVAVNDVGGNPFMPEIDYRGFLASPINGTPQGLAVYQNGVRINEAWGDAVNWDLIPNIAIDRVTIATGNPLFGLNAIGGAVVLDMKNGFSYQGFEIDGRGGSRGRRQGAAQYGVLSGPFAGYLTMEAAGDDGFRYFSGSHIKRLYGDLGYQGDRAEIHVTATLAHNKHGASGPAPVDLVNLNKNAVYTTPQTLKNTLAMFGINGAVQANEAWRLLGDLHYRAFDQARIDGNTTEFECEPGEPVCENDAGDETGIPNYFDGQAPLGAIDRSWTRSRTVGGTVQAVNADRIFGMPNKFTVGVSYDHGWTAFYANQELGVVRPDLIVGGIGHIVEEPASALTSVQVRAANDYLGVYALDTLDVTDRFAVTAGWRFNRAGISLYDMRGTLLNGAGVFTRVNPVAGVTYKITPDISAYAGYSQSNRSPTPLELGCSDPNRPCLIDNFLVSDPPLRQVVSQNVETGLRGQFAVPALASLVAPGAFGFMPGQMEWSAGLYRTHNFDDILSVPSGLNGRGYFVNAGTTLRQGVEASLRYRDERLVAYANYTLTDATFRSLILLGSPDNPLAQALGAGSILVTPGAHLSSVPRHRFKAGFDYAITPQWKVGADVVYTSGPWLRGDEINRFGTLSPYALVNLRGSYQLTKNVQIYGLIENVGNTRARNFGAFFDTGDISFLSFRDPRVVSIGPPLGLYGGVKVTY